MMFNRFSRIPRKENITFELSETQNFKITRSFKNSNFTMVEKSYKGA